MKIACVSDLHGNLIEIPECDTLIIAGDICPVEDHDVQFQINWLNTKFKDWLNNVPAKHIVGIAGNHDFVFQAKQNINSLRWVYLQDTSVVIDGFKFYGTPWQPYFYGWAFNLDKYDSEGQSQQRAKFSLIPRDTNILISHCPPYGILDKICFTNKHLGSKALMDRIKEIQPMLCVFGHIHSGKVEPNKPTYIEYGGEKINSFIGSVKIKNKVSEKINNSVVTFVNASVVDERYDVKYKPIIIDLSKE